MGRGDRKTRGVTRTVFKFFAVVVVLFVFLLSFFEYQLIGASAYVYESGIFNFGFNFYGTLSNKQQDVLSRCILVLLTVLDEFGLQLHQQLNRTFGLRYINRKIGIRCGNLHTFPSPFPKYGLNK